MFKGPEDGEMIVALFISLGTILLAVVGMILSVTIEVMERVL